MGPDLFRLVSILGCTSSFVGGESEVWQFIVESLSNKHLDFGGSSWLSHREGSSFDTPFCMEFILSR